MGLLRPASNFVVESEQAHKPNTDEEERQYFLVVQVAKLEEEEKKEG